MVERYSDYDPEEIATARARFDAIGAPTYVTDQIIAAVEGNLRTADESPFKAGGLMVFEMLSAMDCKIVGPRGDDVTHFITKVWRESDLD